MVLAEDAELRSIRDQLALAGRQPGEYNGATTEPRSLLKSAAILDESPELLARYDAGQAYDELLQPDCEPRPHYQSLYRHLLSLPPGELNRRQSAADLSFLNQGITFTVYGSTEGTERIFPYDLIPRIITRSEWSTIDRGLRQRLTALNPFLHDIYTRTRSSNRA
jgi:hypothetical protein